MKKAAAAKVAEPLAQRDPRFLDNGDGTVTDLTMRLMWSKEALSDEAVSHAKAEKMCASFGPLATNGWRLPTVHELVSLVDYSARNPAIDTAAFPNTRSRWYWTGTLDASSSDFAWCVVFSLGNVGISRRDYDVAFVRAVRSVPAGQ
jgi:hypothetical protein